MNQFIAFFNQFCSYLILFFIMVAIAITGWFIGIFLRKRKDQKIAMEKMIEAVDAKEK